MEIISKILGSEARVKIMRLFLLNKNKAFKNADIVKRSRVSADTVRREMRLLRSINFIKKRSSSSEEWRFNPDFKYALELEDFLINADSLDNNAILNNFKSAGKAKLVVVSGVFIKNKESRVDLLVVGDKLKKGKIDESVRKLEAEIGAELVYAVFDTKEFIYRLSMYDKLVRDIFDFPHEVLLQSKDLNLQAARKA